MKARIEVADRKEFELIKRALEDEQTRSLVKIIGALLPLSGRARLRTLNYVEDILQEKKESENAV
jgi:hypothetical protein